jgi:hypothetical protein
MNQIIISLLCITIAISVGKTGPFSFVVSQRKLCPYMFVMSIE